MTTNIPSKYNPKEFEDKIYSLWEEENCFKANTNPDKKPFTNCDASSKYNWTASHGSRIRPNIARCSH